VIAGDGVGQEVVPEGTRVLERAGRKHNFTCRSRISTGARNTISLTARMMPQEALDLLRPATPSFWAQSAIPIFPIM